VSDPKLKGLEDGLATYIAANFAYSSPNNQTLVFGAGGNVFVQDLPEIEEVKLGKPGFNIDLEPSTAIFTEGGVGLLPSSSRGRKYEVNVRFVVRLGVVMERAKDLVGELTAFLLEESRGARLGSSPPYIVKGAILIQAPDVFQRVGDGHAFASSVVRFLLVA
jgi:hypothetical protein